MDKAKPVASFLNQLSFANNVESRPLDTVQHGMYRNIIDS